MSKAAGIGSLISWPYISHAQINPGGWIIMFCLGQARRTAVCVLDNTVSVISVYRLSFSEGVFDR